MSNFNATERSEWALLAACKFMNMKNMKDMRAKGRALNPHLVAELISALTGWQTRGSEQQKEAQDATLRLKVLKLASAERTPIPERVYPRRMSPADYFGLFYDKCVEAQMPGVRAFVETVNTSRVDIPQELLLDIAEFACEPFSDESRVE